MLDFVKSGARILQIWCSISQNLLIFWKFCPGRRHNPTQTQKSLTGWCSNSSNLVLEFVESGAQIRRIWCSNSSNLVLEFVKSGARIRQIWCSISSNLVLDFAKSGARIRQIWCSISPNLVLNFSGWCSISQSPVVGLVPERAKRRHTRAKIVLWLVLEFVKSGARIR